MTRLTRFNLDDGAMETLRELAKLNLSSAAGFITAAENVSDGSLSDLFTAAASERQLFADQLGELLSINLEDAPEHGKAAGLLHRWWIDIRARFGSDPYAVLDEAERGEDQIKDAYEEALRKTDGSPVHEMLRRQYVRVKAIHDRVRDLRDAARTEPFIDKQG